MKAMTVPVVNQPTVVAGDNPHYLVNCLVFHQTQSSLPVSLGARIDACISYISSQIYFGVECLRFLGPGDLRVVH